METFSTNQSDETHVVSAKTQDLLSSIWLYVDWFYVTKNLTTEERELFADSVDAASYRQAEDNDSLLDWQPVATRWWQDDYAGPFPTNWRLP